MKIDNIFKYNGYVGDIHYDEKNGRFRGSVIGIRQVVEYAGSTLDELESDFKRAIESCLPDLSRHEWV